MKKPWVLIYPLSTQRRLWPDWADAQVDLSLRWVHTHFVGFVMLRLSYRKNLKNSDSRIIAVIILTFKECGFTVMMHPRGAGTMTNIVDPDQTAPSVWPGSTLFVWKPRIITVVYYLLSSPVKASCRVSEELPWQLQQSKDKESLRKCLLNILVFQKMYAR